MGSKYPFKANTFTVHICIRLPLRKSAGCTLNAVTFVPGYVLAVRGWWLLNVLPPVELRVIIRDRSRAVPLVHMCARCGWSLGISLDHLFWTASAILFRSSAVWAICANKRKLV